MLQNIPEAQHYPHNMAILSRRTPNAIGASPGPPIYSIPHPYVEKILPHSSTIPPNPIVAYLYLLT